MGAERPQPEPARLQFVSAAELHTTTPPEPAWVWKGYLARGQVMMLAGKPKAGKSTLACALIEALDAEEPMFLGRALHGGPVVIVSEEGASTLAPKLPMSERVRVLTRERAWPQPSWGDVIDAAVREAATVGAVLLVIDSLSFWAAMRDGQENDAAAAQAVMAALVAATRAGLAVLLVHHQRKRGGEGGDAVRGSGAIFGNVDLLLEIERPEGGAPPSQRRLVAVGRPTNTPPVLVIDRDAQTAGWRVVGEAVDREQSNELGTRNRILKVLPTEPPGISRRDLTTLVGLSWKPLLAVLNALIADGTVERTGRGRAGDPHLFRKVCAEGLCSAGTNGTDDSGVVCAPVNGHRHTAPLHVVPGTEPRAEPDADAELARLRAKGLAP